ncbi:hypothetical protein [Ruminococcus sp.]|uniref:hypothetical protein n=1 Tax=Ruminococcus sp. TaxID=41978 RepID=UPI0025FF6C57|nr:hypothetical protein [Ruminococcus sp.]
MDIIDFEPNPSLGGNDCLGNGEHEEVEIQCDECDYFLECFPEQNIEKKSKD